MRFKLLIKTIIGSLIAIYLLYLLSNLINSKNVINIISNIKLEWFLLGIFFFIVSVWIRIRRWTIMLSYIESNLNYHSATWSYLVSSGVNAIIPFRVGDLIRVFGFTYNTTISKMSITGAIVLERLFDILILLVFLILGISQVANNFELPFNVYYLYMFLVSILFLFYFIVIHGKSLVGLLFSNINPKKNKKLMTLKSSVERFINGINIIRTYNNFFVLTGLSISTWLFEGFMFICVAKSVGYLYIDFGPIFAFSMGTLSTALPSAPGYVGTFDYFVSLGMVAYGQSWDWAVSFAILAHIIFTVPFALIAIYYFFSGQYVTVIKNIRSLTKNSQI